MTFKKQELRLWLRVILLFISLLVFAWLMVHRQYAYALLLLIPSVYFLLIIFRLLKKAQVEVDEFVQAIQYRDFSRNFNISHAPPELQSLRKGFNDINTAFKTISKEKEEQYQYLKKILELVDTGIISYESKSGEMNWMNDTFRKMLDIPYLKSMHSLEKRHPQLYEAFTSIRPGESKLIQLSKDGGSEQLLVSATIFQSDDKINRVIACRNINEAIDETESKAWQKLLSVMTHEIMNSVAPIASLADTLKNRLAQQVPVNGSINPEKEDLELGLETIRRRSEGLLKFAETYRNLSKISQPELTRVYVRDLFESLHTLMLPTLEQKKVEFDVILKDTGIQVEIDRHLVEQVLINLVINALDALKESSDGKITLSALQENNKIVIRISDNGPGIPDELIDKIFIPFFSTKKSGSGIGLSLCKQIMLLHKGLIQVQSVEGKGSSFSLVFPERN